MMKDDLVICYTYILYCRFDDELVARTESSVECENAMHLLCDDGTVGDNHGVMRI